MTMQKIPGIRKTLCRRDYSMLEEGSEDKNI